jgi:hypothetical protein
MRIRLVSILTLVSAVFALAFGGSAGAITNGVPDGTNHPYVGVMVGIDAQGGAWLCSGSLLSSDVFLTAGHCTDGAVAVYMWFDPSLPPGPISLASADAMGEAHTYPDFCLGCGSGLPGFDRGDVGIVTLDQPLANAPHASLPTKGFADTLKSKASVDYVGYGVTFQAKVPGSMLQQPPPFWRWGGEGTRMFATGQVVSGNFTHSDQFLKLSQNASQGKGGGCYGDSGGPVLQGGTHTVLAVNSYGPNPNCSGVGYAQRIDVPAILDWIAGYL